MVSRDPRSASYDAAMADPRGASKRAAGHAAAELVRDGQRLGLGTGSTVEFVLQRLAERCAEGLDVAGVPTSEQTARRARELGIPLLELAEVDRLDLAIDGADEVDPAGNLIKGGGGALTREKIVAAAADRLVVVASPEKLVDRLGATFRLPIEVLAFGLRQTTARVAGCGLAPALRTGPDGAPFVTDEGNLILDCELGPMGDLGALDAALQAIPGVLEHGLFLGMAGLTVVGEADGSTRTIQHR